MRSVPARLLLFSLAGAAAACGGAADAPRASDADGPARVAAAHPCDAFTLQDIAGMFDAPADAVTTRRDAVPGNLTCVYTWDRADREAVEERNRVAMMRAFRSGSGGAPRFESTENEVFITFHGAEYESTADAVQGFEQMVERLEGGISSSAGGATFEVQATFERVDGIGARAAWSSELRQLSVVGGTRLYHVRLWTDESGGADRDRAEAVARRIAAAL